VLDGFHPSDSCWQRLLAFHPRDGHLARHRPVAGVLLDALSVGHHLFSKTGFSLFEDDALMRAIDGSQIMSAWQDRKPKNAFRKPRAKYARDMRACLQTQRRMLCFSNSAL
jgi:hypothetical protein